LILLKAFVLPAGLFFGIKLRAEFVVIYLNKWVTPLGRIVEYIAINSSFGDIAEIRPSNYRSNTLRE